MIPMKTKYQQHLQTELASINNMVNTFSKISLEEMDRVALMNRTDTKYIIHIDQLTYVLEAIRSHYKVLEAEKSRISTYRSLYFDTITKKFYHDHHNGKINRNKIRIRKYVDSNHCFLEIKQKDAKGKTNKSRITIPDFETSLSEKSTDFIRKKTLEDYDLSPSIWNQFNRITLVNKTDKERVTLDFNLSFNRNGSAKSYENIVR